MLLQDTVASTGATRYMCILILICCNRGWSRFLNPRTGLPQKAEDEGRLTLVGKALSVNPFTQERSQGAEV